MRETMTIFGPPTLTETASQISTIFANIGIFFTTALAILAAYARRKEVFRSELHREQFAEIMNIRQKLQEIAFDLYYIPFMRIEMDMFEWNSDALRENAPEDWESFNRYKTNSLELFYKFQSPNYFLFPEWFESSKIDNIRDDMSKFAPFTIKSTASRSDDEIKSYMQKLYNLIDSLDRGVRMHM